MDLGVENPIEPVPILQKVIIARCNRSAVPVITATEMLEPMVANPSPTGAEVSDIANAIFDGTDAMMLSEETATGKYPVECVEVLHRVSIIAEEKMFRSPRQRAIPDLSLQSDTRDAASQTTSQISADIRAKAIVSPLDYGNIVTKISRFRPSARIVAISNDDALLQKSNLVWGVYPIKTRQVSTLNDLFETSVDGLINEQLIEEGSAWLL